MNTIAMQQVSQELDFQNYEDFFDEPPISTEPIFKIISVKACNQHGTVIPNDNKAQKKFRVTFNNPKQKTFSVNEDVSDDIPLCLDLTYYKDSWAFRGNEEKFEKRAGTYYETKVWRRYSISLHDVAEFIYRQSKLGANQFFNVTIKSQDEYLEHTLIVNRYKDEDINNLNLIFDFTPYCHVIFKDHGVRPIYDFRYNEETQSQERFIKDNSTYYDWDMVLSESALLGTQIINCDFSRARGEWVYIYNNVLNTENCISPTDLIKVYTLLLKEKRRYDWLKKGDDSYNKEVIILFDTTNNYYCAFQSAEFLTWWDRYYEKNLKEIRGPLPPEELDKQRAHDKHNKSLNEKTKKSSSKPPIKSFIFYKIGPIALCVGFLLFLSKYFCVK